MSTSDKKENELPRTTETPRGYPQPRRGTCPQLSLNPVTARATGNGKLALLVKHTKVHSVEVGGCLQSTHTHKKDKHSFVPPTSKVHSWGPIAPNW